jgi:hypothetical protein
MSAQFAPCYRTPFINVSLHGALLSVTKVSTNDATPLVCFVAVIFGCFFGPHFALIVCAQCICAHE